MRKSIIGTQIQALRKKCGITQEELGKALGVTAQAVSNWECGGTPDAELLPYIADYFNVTLDELFGRTSEIKKDLKRELVWDLHHTKKENRFEKAYQYCWHIQQGLFDMDPELLVNTIGEKSELPDSTKTTCTLLFEEGAAHMRINKDIHYFYLMPHPQGGFQNHLLSSEQYEAFFSTLGKPDRVKTLLFIYSRKNKAIRADKLAKQLSLSREQANAALTDLCHLNLIYTLEVDVDEGDSTYYKAYDYYPDILPMLPLLFAASDLIERSVCNFNNISKTIESIF